MYSTLSSINANVVPLVTWHLVDMLVLSVCCDRLRLAVQSGNSLQVCCTISPEHRHKSSNAHIACHPCTDRTLQVAVLAKYQERQHANSMFAAAAL